MKTFTGTSSLGYLIGIIASTLISTVYDANHHWFFTQPQPDFWSRLEFVAPGDILGLGFILLVTMLVYSILFRFASGRIFHSHSAAFLAGLATSLVGCSISVYVLMDAGSAIIGPRPFWVHLANTPCGFFWLPIGLTIISFFFVLLIGRVATRRATS